MRLLGIQPRWTFFKAHNVIGARQENISLFIFDREVNQRYFLHGYKLWSALILVESTKKLDISSNIKDEIAISIRRLNYGCLGKRLR